jgi:putative GTP pyrophosphokinase
LTTTSNQEPNADFRRAYWEYRREVLEPTQAAVERLLRNWRRPAPWVPYKRTLRGVTVHRPVARTATRIKRLESVEDKIRRHPDLRIFADGMAPSSFRRMHDTLGARIITYFVSDLGLIHDFITSQDALRLERPAKAVLPSAVADALGLDNDVVIETPTSGYASIHYRVKLTTTARGAKENPVFEIQVRTLIEDAWAEVEHLVGYKSETKAPEVGQTFVILSQQMGAIDQHFDLLNDQMRSAQDRAFAKKPKKQEELGPESLPATLLKLDADLSCNQAEVNGMLRALKSFGVVTVGDLLERGEGRISDIRKLWRKHAGRQAETFDIISVFTYMQPGVPLETVVINAVERAGPWTRRRDTHQVEQLIRAFDDLGLDGVKETIGMYETGDVQEAAAGWEAVSGEAPNAFELLISLYARAKWGRTEPPALVASTVAAFVAAPEPSSS